MEGKSAFKAWFNAQRIALGPLMFQAARLLRDSGVLDAVHASSEGLTLEEIADKVETSRYGVLVLLEAGLAAELVRRDDDRYVITPTGFLILTDELTRINMNVVQECCYQPAYFLEESIRDARPAGLHQVFGDSETIYPILTQLPDAALESWLAWDHYYSDSAFQKALPIVFEHEPRTLLDVGGNTGKWALQCVNYSDSVEVTILDIPGVANLAGESIRENAHEDRIETVGADLRDRSKAFPGGFDAIWMSQFLVCFSEDDVLGLLERAASALGPNAKLFILDNFWDRQANEIAKFCLQTFSLYFTFLANGHSRMYKASDIIGMVEAAGMKVESIVDNLGVCSSLMTCSRR
jgi:SAM-dependent methyltransferase